MNVQSNPGDAAENKVTNAPPPVLSLLPAESLGLTVEKLLGTRWRLGFSGRGELTSSFYFGIDGRVKVFKGFDEATWQLRDGVLELCDVQGVVSWCFDLAFQAISRGIADAGPTQLLFIGGFRKPTSRAGIKLYLLEHRADDPRLERKLADQAKVEGGVDAPLLRDSDMRVSVHANVEDYFGQVHDLVNSTQQLNFTKNRWPDDIEAARARFERELKASFVSECGVVKVADRSGSFGVCGFYLVSNGVCTHFLFSDSCMNLGVEQFVWAKLGRPYVPVKGEVMSDIDSAVDWVRVVDDAEAPEDGVETKNGSVVSVGMFGGINLIMAAPHLRLRFQVSQELNYPFHDWEIFPLPRIIASAEEAKSPANQAILARLPGMPPTRYDSFIIDGTPDAFVISFSSESFCGHYRARSTGLIIPLLNSRIGKRSFTELSFEQIKEKGVAGVSAEQWRFMQEELEFVGAFNPTRFAEDVRRTFEIAKCHNKPVILIGLNQTVGRDRPILDLFGRVNAIVSPIAAAFGFPTIDVADYIQSEADIADDMGGAHYQRHVYAKIAAEIRRLLEQQGG